MIKIILWILFGLGCVWLGSYIYSLVKLPIWTIFPVIVTSLIALLCWLAIFSTFFD